MGMSKVKLYVSECYANGAGLYKRFKSRAKGRCGLLVVRTCFLHFLCHAARVRPQGPMCSTSLALSTAPRSSCLA